MLQTKHGVIPELKWSVLSRGAGDFHLPQTIKNKKFWNRLHIFFKKLFCFYDQGSQFIMSVPHGAVSFAVTEVAVTENICFLLNVLHNA